MIPPATWMLLMTLPFWLVVGAFLGGWLGAGIALVVVGCAELMVAALAAVASRVPQGKPYPEEVVGSLFPGEMRHWHRRKGVCTSRCTVKERAA